MGFTNSVFSFIEHLAIGRWSTLSSVLTNGGELIETSKVSHAKDIAESRTH